jgi:hypothetical protein
MGHRRPGSQVRRLNRLNEVQAHQINRDRPRTHAPPGKPRRGARTQIPRCWRYRPPVHRAKPNPLTGRRLSDGQPRASAARPQDCLGTVAFPRPPRRRAPPYAVALAPAHRGSCVAGRWQLIALRPATARTPRPRHHQPLLRPPRATPQPDPRRTRHRASDLASEPTVSHRSTCCREQPRMRASRSLVFANGAHGGSLPRYVQ